MEAKEFYDQITEDMQILRDDNIKSDPKLSSDDYAFNYWVLSKMYNIDDELIYGYVLEGNDKGVDCYVHFKDSKQLFLIQNKHYIDSTSLVPKDVSHFLGTSLSVLRAGNYDKSTELQDIFTSAKDDPEYKIYFHLYLTNESTNNTVETLFTEFNLENKSRKGKALIESRLFKLSNIIDLYYGKQYDDLKSFSFDLTTNVNGMVLQILPKSPDYLLPKNFLEAYYIMTPIKDVYEMYKKANDKGYALFAENIREYLGKTPVNDSIKRTLESDSEERINFFYYNNGITIICDKSRKLDLKDMRLPFKLDNPQIVNGCQTVSTIYEVLSNYAKKDATLSEFKDVYLMIKVLNKNTAVEAKKPDIYRDIVKYTNKQNALSEKAFTSDNDLFKNIQKAFKERGFLLSVKGGNIHTFKQEYKDKKLNELLSKAKERSEKFDVYVNKISDVIIPIEKLLQVYLAFVLDGFNAYQKKSDLLQKSSDYFIEYALKIPENLMHDHLLNLWLLFKKAELDRKRNEDEMNKLPIPFYVIGFLGSFILNKENSSNIKRFATEFFNQDKDAIVKQYDFLCDLTGNYKAAFAQERKLEYNEMIKTPIDNNILSKEIEKINTQRAYKDIKKLLDSLNY